MAKSKDDNKKTDETEQEQRRDPLAKLLALIANIPSPGEEGGPPDIRIVAMHMPDGSMATSMSGLAEILLAELGIKSTRQKWKEDDLIKVEGTFDDEENIPVLTFSLTHNDKIAELILLREGLKTTIADKPILKHIVEDRDTSAFEKLSDSTKEWLGAANEMALQAVGEQGGKDAEEILSKITTTLDFVALLTGDISFENKTLNEHLKTTRETALEGISSRVQKEINKLQDKLPKELLDAKKPRMIKVPVKELEAWLIERYGNQLL